MAEQRYPTGVRPGNRGGIEIRWQVGGTTYSEFIAEDPTAGALKRAAALRKERIQQQKLEQVYGIRAGADESGTIQLFMDVAQQYLDGADPVPALQFSVITHTSPEGDCRAFESRQAGQINRQF
jgi:hypothetical protein